MDYKVCVRPAFLLPFQIDNFCADYRSLYAKVSMILYKWPVFTPKCLPRYIPMSDLLSVQCGGRR